MRRIMATLGAPRLRQSAAQSVSNSERILLVRLSHLGDVVHALPVFHALRAAHPQARMGWAVQREFAGLLQGLPGLDETILFERRGGARAWLELATLLERFAPTWTVDAQGNLKSALVTLASRAARRSGLAWSDWRERPGALVLTDHAAPAASEATAERQPVHAMQRMLALVEHTAGSAARAQARFDPGLGVLELERGRALLDEHAPAAGHNLVILQLTQPSDVRAWPLEHCAQLVRELCRDGRGVLVLSGPAELDAGRELARALPTHDLLTHWIGQRGLRDLAAVFTAAAARDARFVGCDSGPLHLAAACGLRTLALCGPQDAHRTGPWPRPDDDAASAAAGHLCVVSAQPPTCAPCLARTCSHARGPVCMRELTPERVRAALAPRP